MYQLLSVQDIAFAALHESQKHKKEKYKCINFVLDECWYMYVCLFW